MSKIGVSSLLTSKSKVNKIPVIVVEDHDDIIPTVYRMIGAKQLPFSDMALLHFDSHSDISLPKDLDADQVFNKDVLFQSLSIENWIIPVVYAGHISSVIWMKPYWTMDSFPPSSTFKVGKNLSTSKLSVTSTSNYFISENSYAPEKDLAFTKPMSMHVMTVGEDCMGENAEGPSESSASNSESMSLKLNELLSSNKSGFILDIDLDFFSTTDPFKTSLTARQWQILNQLYKYTPPEDDSDEKLMACVANRNEQVSYLKFVFRTAQTGVNFNLDDSERSQLLAELLSDLSLTNPEFDYEWLHEIGTGTDDCPLPHHISTDKEIEVLVNKMKNILVNLPKPNLITIARSSSDDYCPPHQVENIQVCVLQMLKTVYVDLNISMLY